MFGVITEEEANSIFNESEVLSNYTGEKKLKSNSKLNVIKLKYKDGKTYNLSIQTYYKVDGIRVSSKRYFIFEEK